MYAPELSILFFSFFFGGEGGRFGLLDLSREHKFAGCVLGSGDHFSMCKRGVSAVFTFA